MQLLKKILATLLICFAVLYGLEILAGYFFSGYPEMKTSYIQHHNNHAKILIDGACEAEWTLDPDYIDSATGKKTYNLGLASSDIADLYLNLYLYLKHQPKPEVVLLQITPEGFNKHTADPLNAYRYANNLNDGLVKKTITELDPEYVKFAHIPFVKFSYYNNFILFKVIAGIGYKLLGKENPRYPNGYKPPTFTFADQNALDQDDPVKFGKPYEWDPQREAYLVKILELCKQQDIHLVLYRSPYYAGYTERHKELSLYANKIQKIASAHQIEYIRFDTLDFSKDRSNFFKAPNMTISGATKFNKIFVEKCLNKYIK